MYDTIFFLPQSELFNSPRKYLHSFPRTSTQLSSPVIVFSAFRSYQFPLFVFLDAPSWRAWKSFKTTDLHLRDERLILAK
jgi:hypothetical protein